MVKHVGSLEALRISGNQCTVLLSPMILTRLPVELSNEWSRISEGHESDLEWLLKWLQKEIEIIERSEIYRTDQCESKRQEKGRT